MLIACPECEKDMSTKASSCPNCGYLAQNIRIEDTRKILKAWQALSKVMVWVGIAAVGSLVYNWFYPMSVDFGFDQYRGVRVGLAKYSTPSGIVLSIITNLRIWWAHG